MQLIPLSKGAFAMVDDEDFEELSQWKWKLSNSGYACRNSRKGGIFMHRVLLPTPDGMQVDHVNRVKLDNRRANLRSCTPSENSCHTDRRPNATGYKGVYFQKVNQNFFARIHINRKRIHLGCFDTKEAARDAYNSAAIALHGKYAILNTI